jgi:hypothetical protein
VDRCIKKVAECLEVSEEMLIFAGGNLKSQTNGQNENGNQA